MKKQVVESLCDLPKVAQTMDEESTQESGLGVENFSPKTPCYFVHTFSGDNDHFLKCIFFNQYTLFTFVI